MWLEWRVEVGVVRVEDRSGCGQRGGYKWVWLEWRV